MTSSNVRLVLSYEDTLETHDLATASFKSLFSNRPADMPGLHPGQYLVSKSGRSGVRVRIGSTRVL